MTGNRWNRTGLEALRRAPAMQPGRLSPRGGTLAALPARDVPQIEVRE